MLAEVLEAYTPEERYSMSTFLDGVESYFGYETRKAISMDSTIQDGNLVLNELHLYGSSRLGMMQMRDTLLHYTAMRMYDLGSTHTPLYSTATITQPNLFDSVFVHQRGSKVYEGTNHLGNILVTYSDKRLTECQEDTIYRYVADVKSQTDYSAFGVLLEVRQWYANQDSGGYRFGYIGALNDNNISGFGNSQDHLFRSYDSRLAKYKSIDMLTDDYPSFSPYHYAGNSPVKFIDIEGLQMYVTGTEADEFRNLLMQLTGLELARNSATGMLTYATVMYEDPTGLGCGLVPKINNPKSNYISKVLQAEVIKAIDGGKGLSPVKVIAMNRNEIKAIAGSDVVSFDAFGSNPEVGGVKKPQLAWVVDMTDFKAIKQAPELQAGLFGHIITERLYAHKGYDKAHQLGHQTEHKIMQEFFPDASMRDEGKRDDMYEKGAVGMKDYEQFGDTYYYGSIYYICPI